MGCLEKSGDVWGWLGDRSVDRVELAGNMTCLCDLDGHDVWFEQDNSRKPDAGRVIIVVTLRI